MKNGIEDLRNYLFEQIEELRDEEKDDKKMTQKLEKAKTIALIADKLIQSAKVEVDFLRTTGEQKGTGFLETRPKLRAIEGKK